MDLFVPANLRRAELEVFESHPRQRKVHGYSLMPVADKGYCWTLLLYPGAAGCDNPGCPASGSTDRWRGASGWVRWFR